MTQVKRVQKTKRARVTKPTYKWEYSTKFNEVTNQALRCIYNTTVVHLNQSVTFDL